MKNSSEIQFVFFGTPNIAVTVLNELEKKKLMPSLIVTAPDRKAGRGMKMQSPPVKVWADKRGIPTLQPSALDDELIKKLKENSYDAFVVAAYGKIIPEEVIDIPEKGILNMHPSLLPLYRGPSPIQAQIFADNNEVGTTIMLIDEKMDHGPIVDQEVVTIDDWPVDSTTLEDSLGQAGGALLADVLPRWVNEEIEPQEQEHEEATYCKMIKKEDGLITLTDNPYKNYLKFLAYKEWPRVYFFNEDNKRIIICDANFENGEFKILRVVPEGKKEMDYEVFKNSLS